MSYKTYDKYQEADNAFFKQIPEYWNVFKLKFLVNSLESGKRKDFESEDYAFSLGGEHINWNGTLNLKNKRYVSKEFYNSMSKGKIQENDTLLVKDGATIGKTAFVNKLPQKMAVNEHVFILRNNHRVIPKLLYYLIASNLGFTQIKLTETGSAQGGISQDILDKVSFIIPNNLNEQQKIANYLDKKTAKIDATIAKNEELIELLEEKRVALINQVVTKGLNPDVPMKDSSIEWIGEMPEHWETNRGKTILTQLKRNVKLTDEVITCFRDGEVTLRSKRRETGFTMSDKEIGYQGIERNDLVVHGMDGFAGAIGISDSRGKGSPVLIVLDSKQNKKYLMYYLRNLAYNNVFLALSTGIRVRSCDLRWEKLSNLPYLIPPIVEQDEISNYLDQEITIIYKTIDKIKKHNELLEEYKTSLIHHVVTGKMDVRGEEI